MTSISIKYQIFISSTFVDLQNERTSVIETILRYHHFPVGMEMFNANNKEQWELIKETIDSSDIYILIVSHMYGTLTKGKNPISFTRKEFNYALKRRKEGKIRILCFIRDDSHEVPAKFVETDAYKVKKLAEFKMFIDNSKLTRTKFKSKDDLSSKVTTSLSSEILSLERAKELHGWCKRSLLQHERRGTETQFVNDVKSSLILILEKLALSFASFIEDHVTYTFDSQGGCIIERMRKQTALTDISHTILIYIGDKAGSSEIIESVDMEKYSVDVNLPHLIIKQGDNVLNYIILFNRIIERGSYIKYRTKVKIENYLHNLIRFNESVIEYNTYPKHSFKTKTDIYSFPDTPQFNSLCITVKQDELISTLIPILKNGRRIFEVTFKEIKENIPITIFFTNH